MARIVAYIPDLMDRSKVSAAAPGVTFVARPDQLAAACADADLVVVDLTRPGIIDVVPAIGCRVIAFANHTARDLISAARAAGCEAMPRSDFFANLPDLLA